MIEHMQAADGQNRENDTYSFAEPTFAQHGYKDYIKPVLVTQMQRFGKQGSLEMTVNVLSVNSLTARLIKEVREFIRERKFRPEFVLMRENFPRDSTSDSGTSQSEKRFAGAAIVHHENSGSTDGCVGNVWAGNLSSSLFERPDGTYDLFTNKRLLARWKPKGRGKISGGFDLIGNHTHKVLARLGRDCLKLISTDNAISPSFISQNSQAGMEVSKSDSPNDYESTILLTAVWVAYVEGWLTAKPGADDKEG
ncbi:hypothetical protein FBULB1_13467 [Fusarium bulbicola]|nr:hypothetical protein FBULB1_13467 [Fusarium bulbicola]